MLGVEALAAQRLEDAVMAFREAVDLDPGLERSWHGLAVVMEAMGNPVEAVRCYLKALSANPSDQESRNNLGQLLLQLGLAEELQTQAFTSSGL